MNGSTRILTLISALALLPACGDDGDTVINQLGPRPPASGTLLALYNQGAQNFLVNYSADDPTVALGSVEIRGVSGTLLGMDFRPLTGQLYALSASNEVYVIDPASGVAIKLGVSAVLITAAGYGVDFNPVVDRLRVVDNAQENLRLDASDGNLIADTNLAYATGDPNQGATPDVTAVAYINNFAGATTTTLYGIDRTLGILVTILPPNDGNLNTVGPLAVNVLETFDVGFDISAAGVAYAVFVEDEVGSADVAKLYRIDLATGGATAIGQLGSGAAIRGFAIVP